MPGHPPQLSLTLYNEAKLLSALRLHIEELQHPRNCRTAPLYVYVPTSYTSGLGSQIRQLTNSMMQALLLNRTFVWDAATSVYVHPNRCSSRRYDCLLQPISSCTLHDALVDLPPEVMRSFDDASDVKQVAALPRLSSAASEPWAHASATHARVVAARTSCVQPSASALAALEKAVMSNPRFATDERWRLLEQRHLFFENDLGDDVGPTRFGHDGGAERPKNGIARAGADGSDGPPLGNGRVASAPAWWWVQAVGGHLARPSARVQRFAEKLEQALNLTSDVGYLGYPDANMGYVGVHVRRGDKDSEARVHETATYARAVEDATASLGLRTVLLASDDSSTFDKLPPLLPQHTVVRVPESRFVVAANKFGRVVAAKMIESIHRDATTRAPQANERLRWRAEHEGDEGEILLAQLVLLSRAAVLVGTLTSNYLQLALEMASHTRFLRAEPRPALIDLDGNTYYSCRVSDKPPWGPVFGHPEIRHGGGGKRRGFTPEEEKMYARHAEKRRKQDKERAEAEKQRRKQPQDRVEL